MDAETKVVKPGKMRLDQLLVERGVFANRTRAHASIMAGEVIFEGHRLTKPGHLVPVDIALSVNPRHAKYVSRGGDKLEGALEDFKVFVEGYQCLDVGSSTGGFTDCLLQRGAAHVHCIDVGRGQLHMNLRRDPRVTLQESVNARYLRPADLPGPFDLVVMDLSFISLTKVIPTVAPFIKERNGRLLALVKPQFEVGPAAIGKGGIVRDAKAQEGAVKSVAACLKENNLVKLGVERSRITGADGNVEFFIFAKREA